MSKTGAAKLEYTIIILLCAILLFNSGICSINASAEETRTITLNGVCAGAVCETVEFTVPKGAYTEIAVPERFSTGLYSDVKLTVPFEDDIGSNSIAYAAYEPENGSFAYIHNPEENLRAMEDIIADPEAIYGFSPDPKSKRLGAYAEYDWTDPDVVEKGRLDRLAYHESLYSMYDILFEMRAEGCSIEEMARAVSAERNRLRLESYRDDPEGLEKVKQSNLETYGDENGPTADSLYEKYGSWETVLQKAFGSNAGMDACTGLYDTFYTLYIELGMVSE